MLDKSNLDLVNDKLKVIFATFSNYEWAHIVYMQRLKDHEKIPTGARFMRSKWA